MAHDGNDAYARLDGRTAVVTGASSGIGRAIALELARAGADLVIHARTRRAELEQVAEGVREHGRRVHVVPADLANESAGNSLVEAAWEWAGDVHAWINNAGGDVLTGAAAAWSFERKLEYLWRVDVRATIQLSRLVGRQMIARATGNGDRCLVNVGWDQVAWGMAGDSGEAFGAIKGAVLAFSKSLARSLAPAVRVNCVAPGWIRTAWGQSATEPWQARAQRESLLGRWGTPEDVARVVRFLVSPASGFVNGQVLPVNGGFRGPAAD